VGFFIRLWVADRFSLLASYWCKCLGWRFRMCVFVVLYVWFICQSHFWFVADFRSGLCWSRFCDGCVGIYIRGDYKLCI